MNIYICLLKDIISGKKNIKNVMNLQTIGGFIWGYIFELLIHQVCSGDLFRGVYLSVGVTLTSKCQR